MRCLFEVQIKVSPWPMFLTFALQLRTGGIKDMLWGVRSEWREHLSTLGLKWL